MIVHVMIGDKMKHQMNLGSCITKDVGQARLKPKDIDNDVFWDVIRKSTGFDQHGWKVAICRPSIASHGCYSIESAQSWSMCKEILQHIAGGMTSEAASKHGNFKLMMTRAVEDEDTAMEVTDHVEEQS